MAVWVLGVVAVAGAVSGVVATVGFGFGGAGRTPVPVAVRRTDPAAPSRTPAAYRRGSVTVVGIGDSVTAGSECRCTDFVHLYAHLVTAREGIPARADDLGQPGQTSAGLRGELRQDTKFADEVGQGDVVLITIGANDLLPVRNAWAAEACDLACSAPAVAQMGENIGGIVRAVAGLRAGRPTLIVVTDYWNVFADGDVARAGLGNAYLVWSDQLTRAANTRICASATTAGATCVDLYTPFKGDGSGDPTSLLAADGDHPDAEGHQVIATAIADTVLP